MYEIDDGYSLEHHVQGESRNLDAPLLRLDLAGELEDIARGAPYREKGHSAKTLARYPDLRLVLVALKRGNNMGEHKTDHRITVHCLRGHVRLKLPSQEADLPAGSLLTMSGALPHDVEAREDSAFLLTIAWCGEKRQ